MVALQLCKVLVYFESPSLLVFNLGCEEFDKFLYFPFDPKGVR